MPSVDNINVSIITTADFFKPRLMKNEEIWASNLKKGDVFATTWGFSTHKVFRKAYKFLYKKDKAYFSKNLATGKTETLYTDIVMLLTPMDIIRWRNT